ncbi:MAG: hypothetical protein ACREUU_15800 [Gammaproteobacteria bacterium]
MQGDTPTGMLEDVMFDPKTRRLAFRAKLSIGMAYLGPGKETPARDLFVFEGVLDPVAASKAAGSRDVSAQDLCWLEKRSRRDPGLPRPQRVNRI